MTDKDKLEMLIEAIDYSFLNTQGEYDKSLTYPVMDKVRFIKKTMQEESVSDDLQKELSRLLKDCEIDSEYIHQDFLHIVANHFADWQKERIMANSTNATIGLPYENRYGGYTQLVDTSKPLPIGNNKIAIIFKED